MAFRIEAAACLMFAALVSAQDLKYSVMHDHAHKHGEGTLVFDEDSVWFEETKNPDHSRRWRYEQIQRFELRPGRVSILTYEDVGWQFGRDREYVFRGLEGAITSEIYPVLSKRLDQRFVAAIAPSEFVPLWTTPAKMLKGRSGSSGVLGIGADRIVFRSNAASRTWRYSDVQGIASEGRYELTVVSLDQETRFQLQRELPEERYNALWRRVSEANGLKVFHTAKENHHD